MPTVAALATPRASQTDTAAALLRGGVPVFKAGRSAFNRGKKRYTLQANRALTHLHWRKPGAIGEPREGDKRVALADFDAILGEGRVVEVAFRQGAGRALRLETDDDEMGTRLRAAIRELGGST